MSEILLETTYMIVLGQLPPRKITPNPNSNPNSELNPNPNQRPIFLGGNCPDALYDIFVTDLNMDFS